MTEKNNHKFLFIIILIILGCIFSPYSFSKTPEQKGLDIAKRMEKANESYIGELSITKMILIDAYNNKIVRNLQGKVLEVINDGDKSLSIFMNPQDVKGTKMLTWSHKHQDNDQWLYLPAVRRVKRISSKNKSASFMGSEFTYEDLGGQEIEKFNFRFVKYDELKDFPGVTFEVLEKTAKNKSGYSKQILWIHPKYNNPVKVEYYDRKKELLKVAQMTNFKSFDVKGKTFWRSEKIHMKNVQTRKESIFEWVKRKLGVSLNPVDFDKHSLK
ncbi:secreted protein containing DUF1329 [Candidatus Magnetomorum sp. HK-1]|nr:secreted protein containing DUF1329 [Candidatus Magnetomorum sp. HK-1]